MIAAGRTGAGENMKINRAIFYRLRFENDIEPNGFLTVLSTKIQRHPQRSQSSRTGGFQRMTVLDSRHNRVLSPDRKVVSPGDSVASVVEYLFLVEGNMGELGWLADLLGQYGQVSFPLDQSDWSFASDTETLWA
jgi:hypothetical protein